MFTGLIKDVGTVKRIVFVTNKSAQLTVNCNLLERLEIGSSISINGACHTIIKKEKISFSVFSSPETLSKTNLGKLRVGDKVNLEPALVSGQALDGHFVQGHIDGTGKVSSIKKQNESLFFKFYTTKEILDFIVPKGSIAINGISLTVNECSNTCFSVCIIPHTAQVTNLGSLKCGAIVNIEVDILSKYIKKFITPKKILSYNLLADFN